MHRAAPNATEYREGIAIHVKGLDRKMQKLVDKTKPRSDDHAHHKEEDKKKA
jgi:hypothetical protein